MKLSKEDLITKVNEKVMDEDVKIELMEDISDSFGSEETEDNSEEYENKIQELEAQYTILQNKYKERFLQGNKTEEESKEEDDEEIGVDKKEVIDVKEI